MKYFVYIKAVLLTLLFLQTVVAAPSFVSSQPTLHGNFDYNPQSLCDTAKETLAYLEQGTVYDPLVIHGGKVHKLSLTRVKDTLKFICQNQKHMKDPAFIKRHFEMIRWCPDESGAKALAADKPLLKNLPKDHILMTKYYVHLAQGSLKASPATPFALYGLPEDERHLTLEQANTKPELLRFRYGKQAILSGALKKSAVPVLAYLSREDLEAALLQGTVVVDFNNHVKKTFNVHRNNNIAYDRNKPPYQQERYWYFKEVKGIKGYGKDAEHKITVYPEVTFAADLEQLGLGKLLMIQYRASNGSLNYKIGVLADTGGAFANNLYQIDYLAGSYSGQDAFYQGVKGFPDYVSAYFMLLKS